MNVLASLDKETGGLIMTRNQSHYIQMDLILLLVLFIFVSLVAIYNAQQLGQYPGQNFVFKQTLYYGIGIMFVIALQFIDIEQYEKSSLYLYIFGVLLLIVLHFSPHSIAEPVNNAKSWFKFPGISIQPSEFTKIVFILFLAATISKHKEKYTKSTIKTDLILFIKIMVFTLIPILFILKQPDLGTSLVFVFIAGMLIILSGIDWKLLFTIIIAGTAAIAVAILLIVNFPDLSQKVLPIKPYQVKRVLTWFDPNEQANDDTFHIDRSLQSVGSGQLTGKGLNGLQVQLPEAHTDFIFSVIGETFGFIGGSFVILLFFLLIYKLVTLGMKVYDISPFAAYVCYGYMSLILIHTFQNIGMTIGIMPITGIPLLFISYGGSTILSTMIGFGIVYRIAAEVSKQDDFIFN